MMRHLVTTGQLMKMYKALVAPTHDRDHWFTYQSCDACRGDKLRQGAAALVERLISNDANTID